MKINIVAGILVGYFNAASSAVLIASLLWGIVYCVFVLRSHKDRKEQYLARLRSQGKHKEFGLPLRFAYYAREFVVSSGVALAVGSTVHFFKSAM